MKTTFCLIALLVLTNVVAQPIKFIGTTNGGDDFFSIYSDGSSFSQSNPFPATVSMRDGLLEASDKLIYGVSKRGGGNDKGFIWRMYADGRNYETIYVFNGSTDAQFPNGDLIEGSDGKLYGTTEYGSSLTQTNGALFRLDKDGSNFEILRYMQTSDGEYIEAGLIEASNGRIYGVTQQGGSFNRGTIFYIAKDGSDFNVIYHFNMAAGCCTTMRLQEAGGVLYGLNGIGGGFGNGAVYSIDLNTLVYSGLGGIPNAIGSGINKNFILDNGFIYGNTTTGAANGTGAIFKFEIANGTYTLLHDISATAGDISLSLGSNGNLYGTTQYDGANSVGTIFELTTSGAYTEIYSMTSGNGQPLGELLEVINTPPTLLNSSIGNVMLPEDGSLLVDFHDIFEASDEPESNLEYSFLGVSDPSLFYDIYVSSSDLLNAFFEDDVSGSSSITLRATDSRGDYSETSFTLTIIPIPDDPSVTNASTTYGTFNSSGLAVQKNAVDGAEVTHFQVTNIQGGSVYLNDETTEVPEGGFVTFAEGASGLKFYPTQSGTGSFDIQASTSSSASGLGGSKETATINVAKASLNAQVLDATRTYGAVDPTYEIVYTGLLNGDEPSDIDAPPSVSYTGSQTSDVGTYTLTPSGGSDDNYEFGIYIDGILIVTKAPLTVTADDKEFLYGDSSIPAFTLSYSGFVNGEDKTVLDAEPSTVTSAATLSSPRGDYPITISRDGSDNNYEFIYEDGTLTIGKAVLTVTAQDASSTYGDENFPTFEYTYSGFVNGEDATVIDNEPSGVSSTATASSGAGDYDIVVTQDASDDNYDFIYEDGILTISKAQLTAAANDVSITDNDAIPNLTVSYTGFVNGEDVAVLDTEPLAETSAVAGTPGTYPITVSGGSDNNYAFNYVNGTLVIERVLGVSSDELILYPNPVVNTLHVKGDVSLVTILSADGKPVRRSKEPIIDVSGLVAGHYVIELMKRNGKQSTYRLVKR